MANGFIETNKGFNLADVQAQQTAADGLYVVEVPPSGNEITGLQSGDSNAIADANSAVLNAALSSSGADLVIPSSASAVDGVWYISDTIYIEEGVTLTWVGKLQQLASAVTLNDGNHFVVRTNKPNVTLNNPLISQRGVIIDPDKHGTHACLAIYGSNNTGNITINGGILEWGAYNCFQGGRSNTVFNGTIFRDSGEHIVYGSGTISGGLASGLIFNDCIFERPGHGEQIVDDVEANHVQIRKFADVQFNRCEIRGEKKTDLVAFGINATDVDGMTLQDTNISGYTAGAINFRTYETSLARDLVVNDAVFTPDGSAVDGVRLTAVNNPSIFNRVTVNNQYRLSRGGDSTWNDCTVKYGYNYIYVTNDTNLTFDDCTFDATNCTLSTATNIVDGTMSFTGTQIKVQPAGGQSFNWSPIP